MDREPPSSHSRGPIDRALDAVNKDRPGEAIALLARLAPSEPNVVGWAGQTPLMLAAKLGSLPSVKLLLAHGADPRVANVMGDTALMIACAKGNAAVARELLPGSDPSARDSRGLTALMRAAEVGSWACVGLLLPVSDPLAKCAQLGATALIRAAQNNQAECVAALLPASDALAKCREGLTAADRAGLAGWAHVASMIDAWVEGQAIGASARPGAKRPSPSL